MNELRNFRNCCSALEVNPVSPCSSYLHELLTEKPSKTCRSDRNNQKKRQITKSVKHTIFEGYLVLSLDPNTYRLWKQILTSSVSGSTAPQAPATTKIQISQVVSPLCQMSQNMHVFMKISLLRKTYASCKLCKQKTQIPAIKQFQVKREEQNAVGQYGSLPTCLYPCGATTT
jgi:hypothetical protein